MPLAWLGVVPFFLYTFIFLLLPAAGVLVGAFQDDAGGFTMANVRALYHEPYLTAFKNSIEISLVTALVGGAARLPDRVLGDPRGHAAVRADDADDVLRRRRELRRHPARVRVHRHAGHDRDRDAVAQHASASTRTTTASRSSRRPGSSSTYLYFQIPLMILVIAPAIDGAAAASGARRRPTSARAAAVLAPRRPADPDALAARRRSCSLFGNSFAALRDRLRADRAAASRSSRSRSATYYSGDVLSNPHLAQALALGMLVVLVVMMVIYIPLQRRLVEVDEMRKRIAPGAVLWLLDRRDVLPLPLIATAHLQPAEQRDRQVLQPRQRTRTILRDPQFGRRSGSRSCSRSRRSWSA